MIQKSKEIHNDRENHPSNIHRGYSLIELLVSLSVLVILIGFLLPALHRTVRYTGPLVQCSNNLNQLSIAIRLYADDYNQLMPIAEFHPLQSDESPTLDTILESYGGGSIDLWLCPNDSRRDTVRQSFGSYLYPIGRLQNSSNHIYIHSLPPQFPILIDRVAFHTDPQNKNRQTILPIRRKQVSILDDFSRGNGHNRVMINGKITAFPNRFADDSDQ